MHTEYATKLQTTKETTRVARTYTFQVPGLLNYELKTRLPSVVIYRPTYTVNWSS